MHTNAHTQALPCGAQVLELFPNDVPLCRIMPWLGAALGHCTEQSRNTAVVKHLRRWAGTARGVNSWMNI